MITRMGVSRKIPVACAGLLAISFAVVGCGLLPSPATPAPRTLEPGTETMPAPGSIALAGDPLVATRFLVVTLRGADGETLPQVHPFTTGREIRVERSTSVGRLAVAIDGLLCDGAIEVEREHTATGVLHIAADTCSVEILRQVPWDDQPAGS